MANLLASAAAPASAVDVAIPTAADVPALIALVNALATEPNFLFINPIDPVAGVAIVKSHLDAIAANRNEIVLVAREGSELVGLVTGLRGTHPARRGAIDIGLGVLPDHRRRGIGRVLMLGLERWALSVGCHRLQLRVTTENAAAFALYRKCGFLVEGVYHAGAMIDGRYYDDFEMAKLIQLAG
jgi:GNAT superfamily N-acetyltransferase